MRRFGDADMWAMRNTGTGDKQTGAPTEIPASTLILTEGSGARMSELTPQFLAGPNSNAMVMTTATDYGTLHAAGRPQ
jgi:hypothetical protein